MRLSINAFRSKSISTYFDIDGSQHKIVFLWGPVCVNLELSETFVLNLNPWSFSFVSVLCSVRSEIYVSFGCEWIVQGLLAKFLFICSLKTNSIRNFRCWKYNGFFTTILFYLFSFQDSSNKKQRDLQSLGFKTVQKKLCSFF